MPFPPQPYVFIQLATEQTETMTNDVPQLMSRKLISASQMRGEFFFDFIPAGKLNPDRAFYLTFCLICLISCSSANSQHPGSAKDLLFNADCL